MSDVMLQPEEARPEVDELLRDYFKAELPQPWPTFHAPRMKSPATLWSRNSGRLALAASIAVLVAGYLALAGFFPAAPQNPGLQHAAPPIAQKEKANTPKNVEQDTPTPMPR